MQINDSKHFARRKCTIPFMHNSDEIMFCKVKLLNAHYLDFAIQLIITMLTVIIKVSSLHN